MNAGRFPKNRVKRVLLVLDWYSRSYHAGAARYAREAGWILDARAVHGRAGDVVSHWRGNGVLAMIHRRRPTAEFCLETKAPVVDLAWQFPDLPFPRVLQNNAELGRLVARHFLERGFRHFAFCGEETAFWSEQERFQGFGSLLKEHGIDPQRLHHEVKREVSDGSLRAHRALAHALAELPKPLAVMAHNDDVGVRLIDACSELGLLVPEQVAIVACDNDELVCDFAPVPLSSVDPDLERQAYEGAALLDRLMHGARVRRKPARTTPRGLVVRQSSDIMAVEHVEVAKALRFIWDHYRDPLLGVDDVVGATTLSKTGLNNAFQKHLKCAIGEEVRRVRLVRAKELLRGSSMSVARIAEECGYSDDKHLRNSLRRDTGLSPRVWRQKTKT